MAYAASIPLPMVLLLALAALVVFLTARAARTRGTRPITGVEGMVGETGEVVAPVDATAGKVLVHGEYWDAVGVERLPIGARVRVVRVSGGHLEVEAS